MHIYNDIVIIKWEVSTFPIVVIFFRGCVSEMFVSSYSVTYCISIHGKPGIYFHYHCAVYDECKWSDAFWLEDRIRLLNIELIKCLSDIFCRVRKIKHILSVIHYTIYGAVCFHLPISLVMIDGICILCLIIIIESEVWTITHCAGLGHETMVCAVCLSVFLKSISMIWRQKEQRHQQVLLT